MKHIKGFIIVLLCNILIVTNIPANVFAVSHSHFEESQVKNIIVVSQASDKIELKWDKFEGATNYFIKRYNDKSSDVGISILVRSNHYVDKNVKAGKTYYYVIRAGRPYKKNRRGLSKRSDYIEAAAVTKPSPVELSINQVANSITISLKSIKTADGYYIFMAKGLKGKYEKIKEINKGDKLTLTKTDLEEGNTYYFKSRAYCKGSDKLYWGEYGKTVSVTINAPDIEVGHSIYFGTYPKFIADAYDGCSAEFDSEDNAFIELDNRKEKVKRVLITDNIQRENAKWFDSDYGDSDYMYFLYRKLSWEVLKYENNMVTLGCQDIIGFQPYHNQDQNITWKDCSLRKWLNTTFFNNAFSQSEKNDIIENKLITNYVGASCETNDKVYILSTDEYYEIANQPAWLRDGTNCQGLITASDTEYSECAEFGSGTTAVYPRYWLRSQTVSQNEDCADTTPSLRSNQGNDDAANSRKIYQTCEVSNSRIGVCPVITMNADTYLYYKKLSKNTFNYPTW